MKKYVFSYISFFDNEMTSKVIESDKSIIEVAREELLGTGIETYNDTVSMFHLKCLAFNCDSMFEIIEI